MSKGSMIPFPTCKNNTPVMNRNCSHKYHQKSKREREEYLMFFPWRPISDARKKKTLFCSPPITDLCAPSQFALGHTSTEIVEERRPSSDLTAFNH